MSEPTRGRRTPSSLPATSRPPATSTQPGVLPAPISPNPSGEQPTTASPLRPFVFREVVDRRTSDRRTDDPPVEHRASRTITQPDPEKLLELDPVLRAYVEDRVAAAHRDGMQQGFDQGRTEAAERMNSIGAAIGVATTELQQFSANEKAIAVNAVVELAERVATVVMGRTPHDGGTAALRKIREALEALDDAPFSIAVHPEDLDIVAAGVASPEVSVAADASLAPGEARIRGVWSYNDLTQGAAWEAVRDALAVDADQSA